MSQGVVERTAAEETTPFPRLTVDQYHELIQNGKLGECSPVELLDGMLVWKDRSRRGGDIMSHNPRHANSVARLGRLERRIDDKKYMVRAQLPVTIPDWDEPEPDLAVARGTEQSYSTRHPGPAELLAVVEVSDSSLRLDRTTKLRTYAGAGIPQYWIVNLVENQVEVYTEPIPSDNAYAKHEDLHAGQTLRLLLDDGETLDVAVTDILPI